MQHAIFSDLLIKNVELRHLVFVLVPHFFEMANECDVLLRYAQKVKDYCGGIDTFSLINKKDELHVGAVLFCWKHGVVEFRSEMCFNVEKYPDLIADLNILFDYIIVRVRYNVPMYWQSGWFRRWQQSI